MKRILVAALMASASVLVGCATVFSPPRAIGVSQELPPALQTAQAAVNETNILITAVANVIRQNLKDKVYTKQEAQAYASKLQKLANQVDGVQTFIRAGDLKAVDSAKLLQQAVLALHREVAARARKVTP